MGKTTVAAVLAEVLSKKFNVLAVDADASLNLMSVFGVEDIEPIVKMKDVVEERARLANGLVRMNPKVSDLIDEFSIPVNENMKLLVSGTVETAGSGCLCPENSVLRALLQELVLKRGDAVIIDLEAGLEPMSRGTIKNIDAILAVTEPVYNSITVTERLIKFAGELEVKNALVVGNKIQSHNEKEYLSQNLDVFHFIPYDEEVREASMKENFEIKDSRFYKSIEELAEKIISLT